jgi:ZIP family zinc transporter/zinc and cadmium transporter
MLITLPARIRSRLLPATIAFGGGFMLAAALVAMIPESIRLVAAAPAWILLGYAAAHLFEHALTPHFHFGEEDHDEPRLNPAVGTSAFLGLLVHALFDGVGISAGFMVSFGLGTLVALAILLHKVPEGVTLASILMVSGRSPRRALAATACLGGATILGALAMRPLTVWRGEALALSAGVTLYVAATDLLPEINRLKENRYSLSALAGVLVYFGIARLLLLMGLH